MRDSLIILLAFVCGIFCAKFGWGPDFLKMPEASLCALWLLMLLVGLSVGLDRRLTSVLKTLRPTTLLLPLGTTLGTFAGASLAALLLALSVADCLAVGAGFGYYSLSSVFITQYRGPELGTVALVANILRELFTLLFAPLIVRFAGPAPLISCGGCTTMDTTLPVITRYAGAEWVLPAIVHALILDFSVPFWVTLFCAI